MCTFCNNNHLSNRENSKFLFLSTASLSASVTDLVANVSASITDLVDGIVKLVLQVIQLILNLLANITTSLLGPILDPQKAALILAIDTAIQQIEVAQASPLVTNSRKNTLAMVAFLLKVERELLTNNSIPLNIAEQTLVIQQLEELVAEILATPGVPKCSNTCDLTKEIQLTTCECYTSPAVRQYLDVYFGTFSEISKISSSNEFTLPPGVSVSTVLNEFTTLSNVSKDFYTFILLNNNLGVYDPIALSTKLNAFIQASAAFAELLNFK